MILTLETGHPDHPSLWSVQLPDSGVTHALDLMPGRRYTWQELIAKAAAVGLPVGHPVLAFAYALRELAAVPDVALVNAIRGYASTEECAAKEAAIPRAVIA